jgi:hypothetical protein
MAAAAATEAAAAMAAVQTYAGEAASAPGDSRVTLKGAIALAHQDGGAERNIFLPVDRVIVYSLFDDFPSAWIENTSAEIKLAWQPTTSSEQTAPTGQLFYADDLLPSEQPGVLVSWQDYLLSAYLALPDTTAGESAFPTGSLVVDQGPTQIITATIPFTATTNIGDGLSNLENSGGNLEAMERFLIFDRSSQGTEYVMIVIFSEVTDPSGEDSLTRELCARCFSGLCKLTCWWRGYPTP